MATVTVQTRDEDGNLISEEQVEVPDPPRGADATIDVTAMQEGIAQAEKATTVAGLRTAVLSIVSAIQVEGQPPTPTPP